MWLTLTQVIYWGPLVLEPLLLGPVAAEVILTLAPLAAGVSLAIFAADDRLLGRRPLVITGAALIVAGSVLLRWEAVLVTNRGATLWWQQRGRGGALRYKAGSKKGARGTISTHSRPN